MPTTESTPSASRSSISFRVVIPPAAVVEQCRAGDALLRAGLEYFCRAPGRADAAADAAGQRRSNLPDDGEVVAAAHRGIEIDDLHLLETGKLPDPLEDVVVSDRE